MESFFLKKLLTYMQTINLCPKKSSTCQACQHWSRRTFCRPPHWIFYTSSFRVLKGFCPGSVVSGEDETPGYTVCSHYFQSFIVQPYSQKKSTKKNSSLKHIPSNKKISSLGVPIDRRLVYAIAVRPFLLQQERDPFTDLRRGQSIFDKSMNYDVHSFCLFTPL